MRRRGSGPPAVLWHAMFVDSTSWIGVVPLLQRERTLLLVDGPGWGASDPLSGTHRMSEAVRAAAEVVERLSPGQPVDWVGNGWGGHVGMELAVVPVFRPPGDDLLADVGAEGQASLDHVRIARHGLGEQVIERAARQLSALLLVN